MTIAYLILVQKLGPHGHCGCVVSSKSSDEVSIGSIVGYKGKSCYIRG